MSAADLARDLNALADKVINRVIATGEGTMLEPDDVRLLRRAAHALPDPVMVAKAIHEGLRQNGTVVLYSTAFEHIVARALELRA